MKKIVASVGAKDKRTITKLTPDSTYFHVFVDDLNRVVFIDDYVEYTETVLFEGKDPSEPYRLGYYIYIA